MATKPPPNGPNDEPPVGNVLSLRLGKGPPPPLRRGRGNLTTVGHSTKVEAPYTYNPSDAMLVRLGMAAGMEPRQVAPLVNGQKGISLRRLEELYADEIANGATAIQLKLTQRLVAIASSDSRSAVAAAVFLLTSRYGWASGRPGRPGDTTDLPNNTVYTLRIGAAGDGKATDGAAG